MLAGKLVAEFIGTFFLVFTVGMTVKSPDAAALAPLAIGSALMVMVYATGHISGGHLNPAVTLGVTLRGKCTWADAIPYMVAQVVAAVAAARSVLFIKGSRPARRQSAAAANEYTVAGEAAGRVPVHVRPGLRRPELGDRQGNRRGTRSTGWRSASPSSSAHSPSGRSREARSTRPSPSASTVIEARAGARDLDPAGRRLPRRRRRRRRLQGLRHGRRPPGDLISRSICASLLATFPVRPASHRG